MTDTIRTDRDPTAHERTEPPFIASEGGGALTLACNQLKIDGLDLLIRRTSDGWEAMYLLPDGEVLRSVTANTEHNALWKLVSDG